MKSELDDVGLRITIKISYREGSRNVWIGNDLYECDYLRDASVSDICGEIVDMIEDFEEM